eukprot:GAHX01000994.1.p1 GENE.GAHX01000994.1~~GAHX01000994.1.p1  ORF type:complete len:893 (-),score=150.66 GAHX01000994.1:1313-3991(-)
MLQKLVELINITISGGNDERVQAEKNLEEFSKTNLSDFLSYLSEIISSRDHTVYIRQLSLILISNTISAKNQFETLAKQAAWLHLDFDLRNKVKQAALSCLVNQEDSITSSGASLFAKILKIELVSKTFDAAIIDDLVSKVTSSEINLINASLTQLEYIVEEAEELLPEEQCNKIAESSISLIRNFASNNEPHIISVKTKAFTTLTKALPFSTSYAVSNISDVLSVSLEQLEKVYPLKDDEDLAFEFNTFIGAVFECLTSCIEIYSDCLTSALGLIRPIFETTSRYLLLTYHAYDSWSSLIENFLHYIYRKKQDLPVEVVQFKGEFNEYTSRCIELVLQGLEHYDEEAAFEEEFNDNYYGIKQAASVCFDKLNVLSRSTMYNVVGEYVNRNFKIGSEIHKLESSAICIGLLIKYQVKKFIIEWGKLQVPILYEILSKHNEILTESPSRKNLIKSVLWCFQKLIIYTPEIVSQINLIDPLLQQCNLIINYKLNKSNQHVNSCITNNACVLLLNIMEAMKKQALIFVLEDSSVVEILKMLINVSESMDADDTTLVESSFNTMIALISCSPRNQGYSIQLAEYLLNRCTNIMRAANNITDTTGLNSGSCYSHIASCLATFQTMMINDETKELSKFIPPFVELINGLLNSTDTGLYEEAFFSIGAVLRYFQNNDEAVGEIATHFHSKIIACISNFEELQNCKAAIVTLGDLSHALGVEFRNISDQCVSGLMNLLLNNNVDSSIKPLAIECLADLSMVLEDHFEKYLPHLTPIIVEASKVNLATSAITEDFFESLSISVMETTAAFLHNNERFINSAVTILNNYLQCENLNHAVIDKLILLLKLVSETADNENVAFNVISSISRVSHIIDCANELYGNDADIKQKFESFRHNHCYFQ